MQISNSIILNNSYVESSERTIKSFILIYIISRSFLTIFYDVDIVFGFNILEIVGFTFPIILLLYWLRANLSIIHTNFEIMYLCVIIWVFVATVLKMIDTGFSSLQPLSGFFRVLNGFAVFIVIPLIFNDEKSINNLVNAFFIATFFPLLQGLIQLFVGVNTVGMRTSGGDIEMYYGLYYKYGGYAWAALSGGLIIMYKMGLKAENETRKSWAYGMFLILYLLLASLTLSRTLIFSMLVIVITIAFTIRAKNIEYLIILIILILSIYLISGSGFIQNRYEQIIIRSEKEFQVISGNVKVEGAFHGRVGLWKEKIKEFNERPLFERLTGTNISVGPHSDYIHWVLQYGYIGILLYILLFPGLLLCSIRTLFTINNSYLRLHGFMVIAGLIIWLTEAIIHNSSQIPEYSYLIIGNTAIFLSMSKKLTNEDSYDTLYNPSLTAIS